jgi:hypothetical protein
MVLSVSLDGFFLRRAGCQKRQCPREAGIVFEFSGERESLSLAWHKAEELLLLGFLLGLFLGFRHGTSPVVTG